MGRNGDERIGYSLDAGLSAGGAVSSHVDVYGQLTVLGGVTFPFLEQTLAALEAGIGLRLFLASDLYLSLSAVRSWVILRCVCAGSYSTGAWGGALGGGIEVRRTGNRSLGFEIQLHTLRGARFDVSAAVLQFFVFYRFG